MQAEAAGRQAQPPPHTAHAPLLSRRLKSELFSPRRPVLVRIANWVSMLTVVALVVLGAIVLGFYIQGSPKDGSSSGSGSSGSATANGTEAVNGTVCGARDSEGFLVPDECSGQYLFVGEQLDLSAFHSPSYDLFGLVDGGLRWAHKRLLEVLRVKVRVKQRDAQFTHFLSSYNVGFGLSLENIVIHTRIPLADEQEIPFNATASSDLRTFHLRGTTAGSEPTTVLTRIDATARVRGLFWSDTMDVTLHNVLSIELSATANASNMRITKSGRHHVVTVRAVDLGLSFDVLSSDSAVETAGGCTLLTVNVCSALSPTTNALVASQVLNSGSLMELLSDTLVSQLQASGRTSQDLRHWALECTCVLAPNTCNNRQIADTIQLLSERIYIALLLLAISLTLSLALRVAWQVCKRSSAYHEHLRSMGCMDDILPSNPPSRRSTEMAVRVVVWSNQLRAQNQDNKDDPLALVDGGDGGDGDGRETFGDVDNSGREEGSEGDRSHEPICAWREGPSNESFGEGLIAEEYNDAVFAAFGMMNDSNGDQGKAASEGNGDGDGDGDGDDKSSGDHGGGDDEDPSDHHHGEASGNGEDEDPSDHHHGEASGNGEDEGDEEALLNP